jgi:hypothetical protein
VAALYSNENFPLPAVEALRQLGHDVLTVQEAGNAGQGVPDESVLQFAKDNGRSLLTLNRKHFIALHRASAGHFGIIVCTVDRDSHALAHRIDQQLRAFANLEGQLIRINRPSR